MVVEGERAVKRCVIGFTEYTDFAGSVREAAVNDESER